MAQGDATELDDGGPVAALQFACALIVLYGLVVVAHSALHNLRSGWTDTAGLVRAFVRLFGAVVIAAELLKRRKYAWWLGVILTGLVTVLVAVGGPLSLTLVYRAPSPDLLAKGLRYSSILLAAIACGILIRPSVYQLFAPSPPLPVPPPPGSGSIH